MFSSAERAWRIDVSHEPKFAIDSTVVALYTARHEVRVREGRIDLVWIHQWQTDLIVLAGKAPWVTEEANRLRCLGYPTTIIGICAEEAGDAVASVLRSGADDCVSSRVSTIEFQARIEAHLRRIRQTLLHPSDEFLVRPETCCVQIYGVHIALNPAPFRVLLRLAEQREHWVPPNELLNCLRHNGHPRNTSLVRVYIRAIRTALGPLAHLVEADRHYGRGYRLHLPDTANPTQRARDLRVDR